MKMKIKSWFENNSLYIKEAITGFCVGTAIAFWSRVIVGAIKGFKIVWVPRK